MYNDKEVDFLIRAATAGSEQAKLALDVHVLLIVEKAKERGIKDEKRTGPGTNTGHGHVWPRPDGVRARCGGPGFCTQCQSDQMQVQMSR